MGYYPIFVELEGRRVLVVGGGAVAAQKMRNLHPAGPAITVIAPELKDEMTQYHAEGQFDWVQREYGEGDVEGYDLVMVATDDGAVNKQVSSEARAHKIWVNAADDIPNCDFILPSMVRRGSLVLAASTGGGSPALARRVRETLEGAFGPWWGDLADVMREMREETRQRRVMFTPDAWKEAMDPTFMRLVYQGQREEAKDRLRTRLDEQGFEPLPGKLHEFDRSRAGVAGGGD
ncbi:MAG: bifunctional precorrin-2 dehydrogenase/sirohydrochlorin ferrochelatase [Dehalococcoidia bacterium]